jgi:hypothetical protein
LEDTDRPNRILSLSEEGNKFATLLTNFKSKTNSLAIIDANLKTFKKHAIPAVEKASDFEIFLNDDKTYVGMSSYRFLINEGDKIIIGTNVSNEMYMYDQESDSLQLLSYQGPLIPNQKSGTYPAEVSDKAEFLKYRKEILEDINFMAPVWDEKKQVYYRLSFHMKYDESAEIPKEGFFPQASGTEAFISILDKDFNLITEGNFPELNPNPGLHFVKDGKLWIFEILKMKWAL